MKKNNTVYKSYNLFANKSAFRKIIVNIEICSTKQDLNIGTQRRKKTSA